MSTNDACRPSPRRFVMQRREFLILGSTAAVGLATTDVAATVLRGSTEPLPLLSVGFCNHTVAELGEEDGLRRIAAADRLTATDARIASQGARITVHGYHRAAVHRGRPIELAFRAHSPAIDPATGGKAPFFPWVSRVGAQGSSTSNRVTFFMPVDDSDALHLGVDRVVEAPRSTAPFRRLFAGAREERTAVSALVARRGTYFLAVRETNSDPIPSWLSLRAAHGGVLRTLGGGEPPFSYLVLSIEPATT